MSSCQKEDENVPNEWTNKLTTLQVKTTLVAMATKILELATKLEQKLPA